jgi:predicted RNase H-like nuclease (RuvC/YqgF family)
LSRITWSANQIKEAAILWSHKSMDELKKNNRKLLDQNENQLKKIEELKSQVVQLKRQAEGNALYFQTARAQLMESS